MSQLSLENFVRANTEMSKEKRRYNQVDDTTDKHVSKRERLSINQTIYIKNLNDKINSMTLKQNLYLLCLSYGDVIDIIIKSKSKKMRGQAHIIFSKDIEASKAIENLQGLMFFNKPLNVSFSNKTSNIIKQTSINDFNE